MIIAGLTKSQGTCLHSVLLKLLRLDCGEGWEGTERLSFDCHCCGNSGERV